MKEANKKYEERMEEKKIEPIAEDKKVSFAKGTKKPSSPVQLEERKWEDSKGKKMRKGAFT